MYDIDKVIGSLVMSIHCLEEAQTLAKQADIETEELAFSEALATLKRIRDKTIDDAFTRGIEYDISVRRKPLSLKPKQ